MLNPRAYRAALLEQLTSAATEIPLVSEDDAGHYDDASERREAQDLLLPTSSSSTSHLPRLPLASSRAIKVATTLPGSGEVSISQDSVVRAGKPSLLSRGNGQSPSMNAFDSSAALAVQPQQSRDLMYTSGHGYLVERDSNRSLILSFIDNCLRAGVPEEAIAEHVQFMVASMKESLALHAALHAQRHKERIREYELGALTNMVERQQHQLAEQQRLQLQPVPLLSTEYNHHHPSLPLPPPPPATPPTARQLSPPPPLVDAHPLDYKKMHFRSTQRIQDAAPPLVHHNAHPFSYGLPGRRTSPQRRAPSPPLEDSPLRWTGVHSGSVGNTPVTHASVPIAAWRQSQRELNDGNAAPSAQLPSASLHYRMSGDKSTRRRSAEIRSSRASSRSSSARSPLSAEKDKGKGAAAHHHHHHGLCDVCLRNTAADASAAHAAVEEAAAENTPSTPAPRVNARRGNTSTTAPSPASRTSPSAYRRRYQPNDHYMRPTHSSLVRRASSVALQPREQTLVASNAPSCKTPSALVRGHPDTQRPPPPQRKLVVRSTYSSRLRAAATHQQDAAVETNAVGGWGVDEGDAREPAEREVNNDSPDAENNSYEGSFRVTRSALPERTHPQGLWGGRPHGTTRSSLELSTAHSPEELLTASRAAADVQRGALARPHATTWKLSIDPKPNSTLDATTGSESNAERHRRIDTHDATTLQWQRASSPPPLVVSSTPANMAVAASSQQQQQQQERHAARRPRREPPSPQQSQQPSASDDVPQKLFAEHGRSSLPDARAVLDERPQPVWAPASAAVVSDDDADTAVCVTSPALQLFLETSQRKVRETERLLARTPGGTATTSSGAAAATAASSELLLCSPSHVSAVHPSPQARWRQEQRPFHEINKQSEVSSASLSPSPIYRGGRGSLGWEKTFDTAYQKQQQRLQELRDRLRDYDSPSRYEASPQRQDVWRCLSAAAAASAATSSNSPSQDLHTKFQLHYVQPPPSSALDSSPLIQISPTSSDDDADEA